MTNKTTITLKWNFLGKECKKEVERQELYEKIDSLFKDPNDQHNTIERLLTAINTQDSIKLEENYKGRQGVSWNNKNKNDETEAIAFLACHLGILTVLRQYCRRPMVYSIKRVDGTVKRKNVYKEDWFSIFIGLYHAFDENSVSEKVLRNLSETEEICYIPNESKIFFFKGNGQKEEYEIKATNTVVLEFLSKLAK